MSAAGAPTTGVDVYCPGFQPKKDASTRPGDVIPSISELNGTRLSIITHIFIYYKSLKCFYPWFSYVVWFIHLTVFFLFDFFFTAHVCRAVFFFFIRFSSHAFQIMWRLGPCRRLGPCKKSRSLSGILYLPIFSQRLPSSVILTKKITRKKTAP